MHADQLTVPLQTVRALVDDQFPEVAQMPITTVEGEGTVNAIFRIGERLAARFPLQPDDAGTTLQVLRSEQDAGRELVGRTRFPVPEPVALGRPGHGYPLPWAVQTWVPGTTATQDDPSRSTDFARDLAQLVSDVRRLDTQGRTFSGRGRGG